MGALSISRDDRIDTRGAHLYCRAMHVLGSQKPSLYDLARDLRNSSFILPSGNAVAAEAYLDRKKADYVNPEIYEIMKDKL